MILYRFIKYFYLCIKYNKLIQRIYKEENLLDNLSRLFGTKFKQDWIGRTYAVLNPFIVGNEVQVNTQILEYGIDGISDKSWVNNWIMTNLNIAKKFIHNNNLFDLLTYDIKKIDEYNYLFIIEPIINLDFKKYAKLFIIVYSIIIVLYEIILLIFKYIYIY